MSGIADRADAGSVADATYSGDQPDNRYGGTGATMAADALATAVATERGFGIAADD